MRLIHPLLSCVTAFCLTLSLSANAQQPFTEGEDYTRIALQEPINTSGNDKTIEVVEFFAYACPYCARVETPLQIWQDEMMPENVTFTRVAIPRKGRWNTYAKAYYALQAIDPELEKKLSPEIIKAVVYQKQDLDNDVAFIDWAVAQGVDRKQLTALIASPEIAQQVEDALKLSEQYALVSVPALYVDGRYYITHNNTYYEKIPRMLNALIEQARQEKASAENTKANAQPEAQEGTPFLFDGGTCSLDEKEAC